MKKIIMAIVLVLCTFGAYAENENAATSKEYVDTELATKQPTIPAIRYLFSDHTDTSVPESIYLLQYETSADSLLILFRSLQLRVFHLLYNK